MGRTLTITCDQCSRDITYTGNSVDFRLHLAVESKTPWYVGEGLTGGAVTDMLIGPPLERDMYFCDMTCLLAWAVAEHERIEAYKNRPAERWARGHREQGHTVAYRVVPDSSAEIVACYSCGSDDAFPAWNDGVTPTRTGSDEQLLR